MDPQTQVCRTLTTREVAALLGVNEHTVGRMCRTGRLPFIWAGLGQSKRLFPAERIYREVLGIEPNTEEAA